MNSTRVRRPIVVGYEGSQASAAALDWAVDEAARRNLEVRVVVARGSYTLVAPGGIAPVAPWPEDLAQEVLDAAKARALSRAPGVAVMTVIAMGSPSGVLVDASREAEMVVVGRVQRRAITEALMGSTSSQVAAHALCPVVVVDHEPDPGHAGGVVVGVDGSADAELAIATAFEAASSRGVSLTAVHAWWLEVPGRFGTAWLSEEDVTQLAESAQAVLAESLAGWEEKYPDVPVTRVVTRQLPTEAVLEAASGAALIVVGSRGHGGFAGLVLGSVSQGLIHRPMPCPVVVVRPHG